MYLDKNSNSNNDADKDKVRQILVVEDEKFWVELLKIELEGVVTKIEITHAENGEEAVKLVEESQRLISQQEDAGTVYDAIITDIEMPVMDGCTAVRIIRDLLYTGPIIVWSAYRDSEEDLKRALDIPVSGFCVKEGSFTNLLRLLRNLKVIE